MRALTWQGTEKVSVETVPDPTIQEPTDAIVRITSTAICGSDLHLYRVLGPYIDKGDVLGHEPMGIVEEVGSAVTNLKVGDRVVVPFNISCGHCWMCQHGFQSQCETTQVKEYGTGASLFGYTKMYGQVPGGQAEYLRVPHADYGPIKVPDTGADDQWLFMSDIIPTAWQAVQYAEVPEGGTLAVLGLGPVGQFAARIGKHLGYRVLAVDPEQVRRDLGAKHGIEVFDLDDDMVSKLIDLTDGRGPDGVVDAVGMEAHGNPVAGFAQRAAGLLPDKLAQKAIETAASIGCGGARGDRPRPPRRHGVAVRCLRRHGRPDADDDPLRQADHDPRGTVQRPPLGRRPHAARVRPLGPARHPRPHHAPGLARGRPGDVLGLPEEGGRLHQGRARPVDGRGLMTARPLRVR